ncbi:tellurite resistance TerB family protein [uncultured Oxalicibacterium sp.]|uniref:tellurite resistance TerB family protein n=1 Tax=uncultured Oxalicibacterium sp. TaxID=1168540 RepID=UPI0025D51FDE|nr:tellurite resistance TerB family protein [uncultured Oxalicibacterium sp.]
MSTRQILDQLLRSGQDLVKQFGNQAQPHRNSAGTANETNNLSSLLSGFGGGALSSGALAMLLSNKKARKIGGNLALYGGMAALGALAYKAYGDWQRNQQPAPSDGAPALAEPRTLDRLPAAEADEHSAAILTAMIGAAKADGHIGEEETRLLEQEMSRLAGDAHDRQWLHDELHRPLDPAAVASEARTPEMAAEMYLASLLVVDDQSFMERAYLDELARQLKLPPDLKSKLEQQIQAM